MSGISFIFREFLFAFAMLFITGSTGELILAALHFVAAYTIYIVGGNEHTKQDKQ
ncbi:hypothetical protein [Weissella paramesenteroides]|uniref:Uncharacterized protein n=1 Tax=Weissella paramesenteroides ATCC 33313 TaxID=585506 RepID=C5R840_WEIPA|nr:hypothetical protein [Weissella paramesenteroides]EER75624.1 hypothetical protein HMPREF0877_0135 [Weissella paramesenteroides ATCC 33313]